MPALPDVRAGEGGPLRGNRRALRMTDTEESAMAAAAMTGDSSQPNAGYSTPAAMGMPATL